MLIDNTGCIELEQITQNEWSDERQTPAYLPMCNQSVDGVIVILVLNMASK